MSKYSLSGKYIIIRHFPKWAPHIISLLGLTFKLLNCLYGLNVFLKVVVSFITKKYAKSESCEKEVALADVTSKHMLPLLMEEDAWPPNGAMALIFSRLIYTDMSTEALRLGNLDVFIDK